MSISHIAFSRATTHGSQLASAMAQLEQGLANLNDIFAVMTMMKDGDSITSYMVDKFGFPDVTTAQAAFDELNSLQSKLNANSSVTDLNAALLQAFHKFG